MKIDRPMIDLAPNEGHPPRQTPEGGATAKYGCPPQENIA